MVIMMDNEGPYERAARSLETVTGVQSTPVDVRTECEDLRWVNLSLREGIRARDAAWARARAAVLRLLAHWGEGDSFEGIDLVPHTRFYEVEKTFSITEEELAAEYQRQYDEWVRESSDGQ